MTHKLRYPWVDEDPENLGSSASVLVERVTTDQNGALVLQGRVLKSDGQRGKVRTFPARPYTVASLLVARGSRSRRGMFFPQDLEDPWEEVANALREADHGRRSRVTYQGRQPEGG